MHAQAPFFQFDPRRISFSTPGSFLAIAEPSARAHTQGPLKGQPMKQGLHLRSIHGRSNPPEIFRLALFPETGTETASATPDSLRMENGQGGKVEICFESVSRLRIRCTGTGLRLLREDWRPFEHIVPRRKGTWEINSYQNRITIGVQALRGGIRVDAPWDHCFNVLALWPVQPELALDQLLLAFDHQSPEVGHRA